MTEAVDILNWIAQPVAGTEGLGLIEVRCFIQRGSSGVFTPVGGFLPNSQLDQIKTDLCSWYENIGWSLTKYENEGNINDWWQVNFQTSVSVHIVYELHGKHPEFGTKQLASLTIRKVSDTSAGIIDVLQSLYDGPPSVRKGGPPPSTYPAASMANLRK